MPTAAIWLGKVVSTASTCIRVRRSSDNAEQDIGFSGDDLNTVALLAFVGGGSGYIVTWYDQSGNGNHAEQPTASKQARIVNAGVYDTRVVYDGTDDAFKITSVTFGNPAASIFTRVQKNTLAGASEILVESSTNYNTGGGTAFVAVSGSDRLSVGCSNTNLYDITLSTEKLLSMVLDKAQGTGVNEARLWMDQETKDPPASTAHTNTTGNLATNDVYIGARGGTSLYCDMRMLGLVIYNTDVGSSKTDIENVLRRDAGTLSDVQFTGANNSTTFTDATGKTWSAFGNAKITTNRLALDGTGDYASCTHADFNIGTGDFTIKLLGVRWVATGNRGLFSTSLTSTPGQLALAYDGAGLQLNYNGSESDVAFTPTLNFPYDIWIVRSGSSLKTYIGRTQTHSVTDSSSKTNTTIYLGAYWNTSFTFNGSIDAFEFSATAETP
jgi:hypothetical protein